MTCQPPFWSNPFQSAPECIAGPSTRSLVHEKEQLDLARDTPSGVNGHGELASDSGKNSGLVSKDNLAPNSDDAFNDIQPRGSFESDGSLIADRESGSRNGTAGGDIIAPRESPNPVRKHHDPTRRSGRAERLRLREAYERNGWLPGPEPSRKTWLRRKRAL